MSNDRAHRRDAAITAFRHREAEAGRISSEQALAELEQSRRHEKSLAAWSTRAFDAISSGVMEVSNDFARRGSPFIIRQRPDGRLGIAAFELHRSGSLQPHATLTFALDPDGRVRAETDVQGAAIQEGIAADSVTSQWAERAAEQVIFLVLDGQRMPVPDDDVSKTPSLNQSRNGRRRYPNS